MENEISENPVKVSKILKVYSKIATQNHPPIHPIHHTHPPTPFQPAHIHPHLFIHTYSSTPIQPSPIRPTPIHHTHPPSPIHSTPIHHPPFTPHPSTTSPARAPRLFFLHREAYLSQGLGSSAGCITIVRICKKRCQSSRMFWHP